MKSIPIADAAMPANLRAFQDGDFFQESITDLQAQDIADGLGHLKARDAENGKLAGDQVWVGDNEFATSAGDGFEISGDQNVVISTTGVVTVAGAMTVAGALVSSNASSGLGFGAAQANLYGKVMFSSIATLADADATIAATVNNVPTLTANRVFTLPSGGSDSGRLVLVRRSGTAAFTATVVDPTGSVTCGVIPSGAAGWIICQFRSSDGNWVPVMWAGNTTSIRSTV